MEPKFTIKITMRPDSFRAFSFFHTLLLNRKWFNIAVFPLTIAAVGIFFTIQGNSAYAATLFMMAAIFCLGYALLYQRSIKQQIAKFNMQEGVYVYTLSFDEGGIDIRNEKEHTRLLWNEVYHVHRYKENYFLYANKTKAFLIPFSCIKESGATKEELWSYFETRLPADKLA